MDLRGSEITVQTILIASLTPRAGSQATSGDRVALGKLLMPPVLTYVTLDKILRRLGALVL